MDPNQTEAPRDGDLIAEEPVVQQKTVAQTVVDTVVPPAEAAGGGVGAKLFRQPKPDPTMPRSKAGEPIPGTNETLAPSEADLLADTTIAGAAPEQFFTSEYLNFNTANLDNPQEITAIMDGTARYHDIDKMLDEKRRTLPEMKDEAMAWLREAGVDPDLTKINKRAGTNWGYEELTTGRWLMQKQAEDVYTRAQQLGTVGPDGSFIQKPDADPKAIFEFRKAMSALAATQKTVQGKISEAGRALSAMRIKIDSSMDLPEGDQMIAALANMGGPDVAMAMAGHVMRTGGDTAKIVEVGKQGWAVKTLRGAEELFFYSVLSGPATHIVNVEATALLHAWYHMIDRPFELAAGKALDALSARGPQGVLEPPMTGREILAGSYGYLAAIPDAAVAFVKKYGQEFRGEPDPTSNQKVNTSHESVLPEQAKWLKLTSTPLLAATDEFMKTITFRMAYNQTAVMDATRMAMDNGIEPGSAEFMELLAWRLDNPSEDMRRGARAKSEELTLTNPAKGPLAKLGRVIQGYAGGRLVLPFLNIISNLNKFAMERTLGPAMALFPESQIRADLAAGGRARDAAVARMGQATVLWGLGLGVFQQKNEHGMPLITGAGPADYKARQILEKTGWRPLSIWDGEKYRSYQGLDPVAGQLAIMASTFEAMNNSYNEEDAQGLLASAMVAMLEVTYNKGIGQTLTLMMDVLNPAKTETTLVRWLKSTTEAVLVPYSGLRGQIDQFLLEDPDPSTLPNEFYGLEFSTSPEGKIQRTGKSGGETLGDKVINNLLMQLRAKTPGWGHRPPKTEWDGNNAKADETVIFHRAAMSGPKVNSDPATRELLAHQVYPTDPGSSRAFRIDRNIEDQNVDLLAYDPTGWEYYHYRVMVGQERRKEVEKMLTSETYKNSNNNEQRALLRTAVAAGGQNGWKNFLASKGREKKLKQYIYDRHIATLKSDDTSAYDNVEVEF